MELSSAGRTTPLTTPKCDTGPRNHPRSAVTKFSLGPGLSSLSSFRCPASARSEPLIDPPTAKTQGIPSTYSFQKKLPIAQSQQQQALWKHQETVARLRSRIQICGVALLCASVIGTLIAVIQDYIVSAVLLGVLTLAFPVFAYLASLPDQTPSNLQRIFLFHLLAYASLLALALYTVITFIEMVTPVVSSQPCTDTGSTKDAMIVPSQATDLRASQAGNQFQPYAVKPTDHDFAKKSGPADKVLEPNSSRTSLRHQAPRPYTTCTRTHGLTYMGLSIAAAIVDCIASSALAVYIWKLLTLPANNKLHRLAPTTSTAMDPCGSPSLHDLCNPSLLSRSSDGMSSAVGCHPMQSGAGPDSKSIDTAEPSEELRRIRQWVQTHCIEVERKSYSPSGGLLTAG